MRLTPTVSLSPARRLSLALAGSIAVLAAGGCASGGNSTSAKAGFAGAQFPAGVRAPDFMLTDQLGRRFTLGQTGGRVRVLAFLSARTRLGFVVAQQVRGALDELGPAASAVSVLLVSTEKATTPARASSLLRETSLAGRARFLTGTAARLNAVWKAYGIPPAAAGKLAYMSSTPVILLDRRGFERVGFPVEQLTPEGLAHDIRTLIP